MKQHQFNLINNKQPKFGNGLSIGDPGSCKTSGNRRMVENRWEMNHKVFCLYDGGARMDNCYFLFPSVSDFWKMPKLERGKIVTARSYPTELLTPMSKRIMKHYKKVPNPTVLFTIPVCDITEEDLVAILGSGKSTDSAKVIFRYIKDKINDDTTAEDYLNHLSYALRKVEETDGIKMSHHGVKKIKEFFVSLNAEGLLSSKNASTAINIPDLIKNKRTISVLVLRHIPEAYWGFLVHFFMKHVSNILAGAGTDEGRKINQKTTIMLNEVADLLDDDEEKGSASHSINKMIAKIQKQSRTFDIFLLMDTQLPRELPDVKETLSWVCVYRSPLVSIEEAMRMMGKGLRTGEITQDDLSIIPQLSRGWYYLFDKEKPVTIHKAVWTRSRTYEDGEDFYDIYDKVYGKAAYYNIKHIIDELNNEAEKSKKAWNIRSGKTEIEDDDYDSLNRIVDTMDTDDE